MSILSRRKELGLTQADLARALNVDQTAVCNWESGKNKPATKRLVKLAAVLRCTVDELLTQEETA